MKKKRMTKKDRLAVKAVDRAFDLVAEAADILIAAGAPKAKVVSGIAFAVRQHLKSPT